MTSAELIANFSYLQDERGSPNFDDDEVLVLLNMAQLERLRRLLPDDQGGVVNFEFDENTLFNVKQLIYPLSTTMSAGGVITFSALTTSLRSATSDSTCSLHRIVDLGWTKSGVSYPVKFVKNNNWYANKRNVFKAGASTAPVYKVDATNITFDPIDTSASIIVDCLKTPRIMTAINSPEWDDQNANLIVEIALQYAAQATRDQELMGMIKNSAVSQ
jgi:hypothetical protein